MMYIISIELQICLVTLHFEKHFFLHKDGECWKDIQLDKLRMSPIYVFEYPKVC